MPVQDFGLVNFCPHRAKPPIPKLPSRRLAQARNFGICARSSHRLIGPFQRSIKTHLFYPGDQTASLYAQKLRGTITTLDPPAGLLQNSKKVLSFAASHF